MELDRITRNPEVVCGKPCVRGMRVTVGFLVEWWDEHWIEDRILSKLK
jgi:uncharacterized protein (DUF433 family)